MSIALINIGSELLSGKTINTNAADIGKLLKAAGYHVDWAVTIHDGREVIMQSLDVAIGMAEAVIVTGGLGPTSDDITKETLRKYFGGEMVLHEPTWERIARWYEERGRKMNDRMKEQAMLPSSCEVLENMVGSAPGMLFWKEGKPVFSLPGVPQEMRWLMEEKVMPVIQEKIEHAPVPQKVLRTFGIPESEIATKLDEIGDDLPDGIELAFYPSHGHVRIEIYAKKGFPDRTEEAFQLLNKEFGYAVFSNGEEELEAVLGKWLTETGQTLALAESCTGGALAAAITSVSGSSKYFKGSAVTYAEWSKVSILGIPASVMEEHSVVSREVAERMAVGARKLYQSDIGIGITGTAEVNPGDPVYGRPVIWIAISDEQGTISEEFNFFQDRASNIKRAVRSALFMCLKKVRGNFV